MRDKEEGRQKKVNGGMRVKGRISRDISKPIGESGTVLTCPYTFKFRTPLCAVSACGVASDGVRYIYMMGPIWNLAEWGS